jgi:hypothetical protein
MLGETDDVETMSDWCVGPAEMVEEMMSGKKFMRRIEEHGILADHAGWEFLRRSRRYLEHDYERPMPLAGAWGALTGLTMSFLNMKTPPDEVMINLLEGAAGVMRVYEVYFITAAKRDRFRDNIWPEIPVRTAAGEWRQGRDVIHPNAYDDTEGPPADDSRLAISLEPELSDDISSEARQTADDILDKMGGF